MADHEPTEPFPIFLVSGHYLIYDINTITYVRRQHHICGVLLGTLPQIPQQNVFLGVPLHLMPEEARVLVENGAAFVVDDVESHHNGLQDRLSDAEKHAFRKQLEKEGHELAVRSEEKMAAKKEQALKRIGRLPKDGSTPLSKEVQVKADDESVDGGHGETSLFDSSSPAPTRSISPTPATPIPFFVTPTLSYPPLPPPSPPTARSHLPLAPPNSYPLYSHLHSLGYFMTPGLRFGCQYSVYPGDPLRFHSHFLAIGAGWDEPLDLLGLVGGGRLGTGVKKGFLIGGQQEDQDDPNGTIAAGTGSTNEKSGQMRTFCLEWASM